MKLTAAITIEPHGPLHLASMFSMREIGAMGELSAEEKAQTYQDGTVPTIQTVVDGDQVAIRFHWDLAKNPVVPGHSFPAIASFTIEVTKEVEAFEPKNADQYGPLRELYRLAAYKVAKRLLSFFRFELHNPFTWPIETTTFKSWKWLDEQRTEIHEDPKGAIMAHFPGFPSPANRAKLSSTALPRSREHELVAALQRDTEPHVSRQLQAQAQEAIFENQYMTAVLLLAVSCEVSIKTTFFKEGSPASEAYDFLEDNRKVEASPIDLIHKVAKRAFGSSFKEANAAGFEAIDHLFRCRNKVAHRARAVYRTNGEAFQTLDHGTLIEWWYRVDELLTWLQRVSTAPVPPNPSQGR